jgi:ketosteroid isomerase-like protein
MRDAGHHVLVKVSEHGIGRTSGVVVDRSHWALWTLQDGKVVSLRNYYDHTKALRAVGLQE